MSKLKIVIENTFICQNIYFFKIISQMLYILNRKNGEKPFIHARSRKGAPIEFYFVKKKTIYLNHIAHCAKKQLEKNGKMMKMKHPSSVCRFKF